MEVSRLQVESEREALASERKSRVAEAKPNIILESDGGAFQGDGQSTYPFMFSNAGNTACGLLISLRHQLGRIEQLHKAAAFERGNSQQVRVQVDRPELIEGSIVEIRFDDRLGNSYIDQYMVTRQTDHPHSSIKINRINAA